ncbi:Hypothetical_protein [Hexamita inflata]|uniref:Hypothetical_protein n=1 Tax=Hexamita inflata TaxID=28002 RepID=A0AA86U8E2_9EUKA|nr:Hypothetical protein HINF_LOCUS30601 [Hexamita inflata]
MIGIVYLIKSNHLIQLCAIFPLQTQEHYALPLIRQFQDSYPLYKDSYKDNFRGTDDKVLHNLALKGVAFSLIRGLKMATPLQVKCIQNVSKNIVVFEGFMAKKQGQNA